MMKVFYAGICAVSIVTACTAPDTEQTTNDDETAMPEFEDNPDSNSSSELEVSQTGSGDVAVESDEGENGENADGDSNPTPEEPKEPSPDD